MDAVGVFPPRRWPTDEGADSLAGAGDAARDGGEDTAGDGAPGDGVSAPPGPGAALAEAR